MSLQTDTSTCRPHIRCMPTRARWMTSRSATMQWRARCSSGARVVKHRLPTRCWSSTPSTSSTRWTASAPSSRCWSAQRSSWLRRTRCWRRRKPLRRSARQRQQQQLLQHGAQQRSPWPQQALPRLQQRRWARQQPLLRACTGYRTHSATTQGRVCHHSLTPTASLRGPSLACTRAACPPPRWAATSSPTCRAARAGRRRWRRSWRSWRPSGRGCRTPRVSPRAQCAGRGSRCATRLWLCTSCGARGCQGAG
mmetsp:Transcript_29148/g.74370  ORF Transcript_29148/g.74370 Transcript_29148/m.74370 type:complete len:252 (-) Transcript_29148:290-1045(-)